MSLVASHPELVRRAAAPARPVLSYELFPARSDASWRRLEHTIAQLESTEPAFVSVTSRPGYQNFERVHEIAEYLLRSTTLKPLVHLTCTGSTAADLRLGIAALLDLGVRGILALRGDRLPGHVESAEELPFARYLVELVRQIERERGHVLAAGRVGIGVASYPHRHPESPSDQHDIEVLVAKERSGADYAITQAFFDADVYAEHVRRARRAGVTIPIVPGIVPTSDPRRLHRLAELSGVAAPRELLSRLERADGAERLRIGVEFTTDLARRVLDQGAPGLHLFTFNRHEEALEVLEAIDLDSYAASRAA